MPDLEIADCINETCPWSGKPVQPEALTKYHGEVVGFCNTGCRDKFEAAVRHFGDRCEPPAAVRRAASPERTPTGAPRTAPRPTLAKALLITHNPHPGLGHDDRSLAEGSWRAGNDGQSSRKGRHAAA